MYYEAVIFVRDIFDKNNKNLYDKQVVVVRKNVGLVHKIYQMRYPNVITT